MTLEVDGDRHDTLDGDRWVAARRALLGWSREKVAEAAGTSVSHMGLIERGDEDSGFVIVLRLAKALDMTPGELLDGIDPDA
jgi:transcriptional regulator with XRE-family HTH domain